MHEGGFACSLFICETNHLTGMEQTRNNGCGMISITDLHLHSREVKLHNITEEGSVTEVTVTHSAVSHMPTKDNTATKGTGCSCDRCIGGFTGVFFPLDQNRVVFQG